MANIFRRTLTVGPEHIDELGHVNNVVWLRLIVDLSVAHSLAEGMDGPALQALGGTWLVRRHEIDYLRPALPGQRIQEETWISEARGAQCVRCCRFVLHEPGGHQAPVELVRSATQWVWVDLERHRPRRIPEVWMERFA